MVHILPGYPKQSPEDPKVVMIALYLSLPPEVSQSTVLSKDILATVIIQNMPSIGKSLNGFILSVYPTNSPPTKVPTNGNRTPMVIVGVTVGLFVVVIAASLVVYKKSRR